MTEDSGVMKAPLAIPESTPAVAGTARAAVLIAIVLGAFVVLWPSTLSLAERWSDTVTRAYTHGSMIVLISAWLLWRRRGLVATMPASPSWLAFGGTAVLGGVWLVAWRSGVEVAHVSLLPPICAALVATVFGFPILRKLWLPIAYLFFTIPLWDMLNPALQWASAYAVRVLLSLVGIPVYFDGLEFQIPAGRFEIAGGCSGLHFFIVGIAISVLYGEMNNDTRATRFKLIALGVLFALLTNWIRISIIIVAGHLTQMQHHLVREEHYTFGWGMFAGAMAIFFLIVRRWPATAAPPAEPAPAAMPAAPLKGLLLAALAVAAPAIASLADRNVAAPERAAAHALPREVPGWHRGDPVASGAPRFLDADATDSREYSDAGVTVQAFGAVYRQQMQGKELANFENLPFGENVVPASGFALAGDWLELRVRDRAGRSWLARVRYRIDDAYFAHLRRAQIAYGLGSLHGDPVSSATVLRARCASDCDAAREALDRFVRDASRGVSP
jgi:exosortase